MSLVTTIIASFVIIFAVVAAMAIGVMAGRAPIRGSCGGLNGNGCKLCSGSCPNKERAGGKGNAD